MPIFEGDYGIHRDVLTLEFGTGDIAIFKGREEDRPDFTELIFVESVPKEIGTETTLCHSSDDLPNIRVVMRFTDPRSLKILIQSLNEML